MRVNLLKDALEVGDVLVRSGTIPSRFQVLEAREAGSLVRDPLVRCKVLEHTRRDGTPLELETRVDASTVTLERAAAAPSSSSEDGDDQADAGAGDEGTDDQEPAADRPRGRGRRGART